MYVDFRGTSSVQYDRFLDSFECKVADEHHVEGQEVGVSLYIHLLLFINCNFKMMIYEDLYSTFTGERALLPFPEERGTCRQSLCSAGFSWWEAWGQLVRGQCPAIT